MRAQLYLLRHGTSVRKAIGIWGRLFDAPLDPGLLTQLDEARETLSRVVAPRVLSSPLARCIQSLRYVFPDGRPVQIIDEFRAYHSGQFENLREDQIATTHPDYLAMSYAQRFRNPRFGEESLEEQTARVRRGLRRLLSIGTTEIVLCTHYSVINVIANIVAGNLDVATYGLGLYDVQEGEVLSLEVDMNRLSEELNAKQIALANS